MAKPKVGSPEYIKYLLSPDTPLEFHVQVGDPQQIIPERIGAVKWMLIARSKVLRVMLLESKMKETSEFKIEDLDPCTFKNFLTYMYGHDNTSTLMFEDSIKLLNAAEKYDVEDLRTSLGDQIQDQMSTENLFTVLKYPEVCEQVAPLWETTTEMIQCQTEDIFASQQFVELSLQAMLFILQQDNLSVEEIDIWRAALRWAKHKGQLEGDESASPGALRELVLPLLKHIRLCTLTFEQVGVEIFISDILTADELKCIFMSLKNQQKDDNLVSISNQIVKRGCGSNMRQFEGAGRSYGSSVETYKSAASKRAVSSATTKTTFSILTKVTSSIELCSIVCEAKPLPAAQYMRPVNTDTTYPCQCQVKITRITDYDNNTSSEPAMTVSFNKSVRYGEDFNIPLRQDNRAVVLRPNTKYDVEINSTPSHPFYYFYNSSSHEVTTNFEIDFCETGFQYYVPNIRFSFNAKGSHMKMFNYRVISNSCQQAT